MTTIAILDDDHVIRLTRYAISGPGEITTDWAREFFMPEDMDPARVYAHGHGLHPDDGVSLIPMSAKLDLRKGSEADILIFRRGAIDAAFMDANPKLKLIQRLGARADAIDLAAAAKRGIQVSCVPRATLQLTAEHAILLMLALGKRLLEADDAVRKDRWDRDRVRPDHNVAYNWAGIPNIGGLFNKTLGIIGLGEVGSHHGRHGACVRDARALLQPQSPARRTGREARRRIRRASPRCSPNPISCRCTRPTFRTIAG